MHKNAYNINVTVLSPVHTKNDNYKDNNISVHTTERSSVYSKARASAALNSRARYSRIDSDWLSMFLSFISWKNRSESDSNDIFSLCLYRYSCGVDSALL